MIEIIGIVAAIITTTSFLPQALKIIKTKDTSSISAFMYALMSTGMFLWLLYGLFAFEKISLQIVLANGISLIFTLIILFMKLKHK